ncbi:sensor histidine kinase [Serinicoccus marinus]|uniref:sensor histidine kinase n=1 Tax=Serinicoccus marinus TaxID=247333 RepID=UPI0003B64B20|nr:histidine kinase [Serinicoccus marinus]
MPPSLASDRVHADPSDPSVDPPDLRPWQQAWRLGTVWLLGGLPWLVVFGLSPVGQGDLERTGAVDVLLVLDLLVGQLCVLLVAFRRRRPATVAVVVTLLSAVSAWGAPAALLAVLSLATRRRLPPLLVVLALNALISLTYDTFVAPTLLPDDPAYADGGSLWQVGINTLVVLLVFCIVGLIGWNIGGRRQLIASWRSQAQTARREQAARVSQARLAERARIAREMHDVMGHRLSLVAMHAGALAHRPDLSEQERRASAEIVRDGAHQALQELRDVLGVLRAEEDPDPLETGQVEAPQPTLTALPSLVAEATSSGQEVLLEADPDLWSRSVHLSDLVGRHAYRVVQEALTNARKHAPDSVARVRVAGSEEDGLEVVVRNAVGPTGGSAPSSGMGLPGMAERVHLADGRFEAGVEAGEFVVRVWLPWQQEGQE